MTKKLLPCPFCQSQQEIIKPCPLCDSIPKISEHEEFTSDDDMLSTINIYCPRCNLQLENTYLENICSTHEHITKWNTRA